MESAPSSQSRQAERQIILVVEDNVLVRLDVAAHLRNAGLRVLEASCAAEALAILGADRTVDLIFSDIQMDSQLDGFTLAKWVRNNLPEMRILLTAGSVSMADAADRLSKSVPLLMKPYHIHEIERQIRLLLAAKLRG